MASEITPVKRMQLKKLIDQELDKLYQPFSTLGKAMGELFGRGNLAQLRNLESVAAAATRTSWLKNHIKNQTGKDRLRFQNNQTWARNGSALGRQALELLDDLGAHAVNIVKKLEIDPGQEAGQELARTVEIELQRGLVQTAVCTALYADLEAQS